MNKRSDVDADAAEVRTGLRFAQQSGYLNEDDFHKRDETYDQLCAGLVTMMKNADSWYGPSRLREPPALDETNGTASTDAC